MTNINEDLNQPFKVFVRVRPFNEKEIHSIDQNPKKQNKNFLNVSQNQVSFLLKCRSLLTILKEVLNFQPRRKRHTTLMSSSKKALETFKYLIK